MNIFNHPHISDFWLIIGLAGQSMFFMRFFVQWIATERAKVSTIPDLFWYFSIAGGVILLIYAIHQLDPVFILGQATGMVIYLRNLYFVHCNRKKRHSLEEQERL
ncbi:MAG: lipid-A-disaccharide synthase N-terminal domain-containing protein [Pseudobdellovibrionaceae bacterium]